MTRSKSEPNALPVYDGPVEGILETTPDELLRELMGVIEAAIEKSIRLTKSGIPPKPLWGAINDRLLWQDPKSILYDWDEADQVRFVYSLAVQLALVQPDDERLLTVGPGADAFFLATPTRRAEMLLRAYMDVVEWDERCDARNDQGHRYNFGQTFRRDFQRDAWDVREKLLSMLGRAPREGWIRAYDFATALTVEAPDCLISEDDEVPMTPEGEPDPEIERLVEFWIMLAARFGWVGVARTPVDIDSGGERLFRVSELGRVITGVQEADYATEDAVRDDLKPFVVQPNNDIVFYRAEGDLGDEFLLRRISTNASYPDWSEPVATYHVTPDSLRAALETGLDPDLVRHGIIDRARSDVPQTFAQLLIDAERQLGRIVFTQGLSAVELGDIPKKVSKAITDAGFPLFGNVAIVPWRRWHEFAAALGEDVTEGFRYPAEEALGNFTGHTLKLEWPVLPMVARDLLDAVGAKGEPPTLEFDDAAFARIGKQGWTPKAVAEAVLPITGGELPKWLSREMD